MGNSENRVKIGGAIIEMDVDLRGRRALSIPIQEIKSRRDPRGHTSPRIQGVHVNLAEMQGQKQHDSTRHPRTIFI